MKTDRTMYATMPVIQIMEPAYFQYVIRPTDRMTTAQKARWLRTSRLGRPLRD